MKNSQKLNSLIYLSMSGMTMFMIPFAQTSCSTTHVLDVNKPPILPKQNQHSLSISEILSAKSPLEIISKTPLFKESVHNMQKHLNENEWDFSYINSGVDKFHQLNQEVGIVNEWGKTKYEKMMYSPQNYDVEYNMTQKWLPNFTNLDKNGAILKTKNIDWVIKDNQFGFLPSNLSQLLYYCSLESIAKIFNVNEVIEQVKMNFNDEVGSADILISTKTNKYLFNYLSTDENTTKQLKRNYDFKKYIYDRTLFLDFPRFVNTVMSRNQFTGKWTHSLNKYSLGGTVWIFDRVYSDSIPKDYYEFLVGTNLHVLNSSFGFNKDRYLATGTHTWTSVVQNNPSLNQPKYHKTYNQFWDGGLFTLPSIYTNNNESDSVSTILEDADYVEHQLINKPRKVNVENNILVSKTNLDYPNEGQEIDNTRIAKTNLNSKNIVSDLVWYTPEFTTTGSYTLRDSSTFPVFDLKPGYNPNDFLEKSNDDIYDQNKEKWYENWQGKRTGTISNAGADFAITKIRLSKNDIKKLLPTLYPILDTEQEKNWYIGMGKNNLDPFEIAPNSTLFVGGYPENMWKTIKSFSGKIYSQERYIPREPQGYVQSYWTKYNEKDNKKFNEYRGMVSWYENRFKSPSMSEQENDIYMPHGMQINKILQQSTITMSNETKHSEDDILHAGSSGSMIINSRFELVGALYAGQWKTSNGVKSAFTNIGVLFKNYTEENKNFSIIRQVVDKLKKENIKTLKLNSK